MSYDVTGKAVHKIELNVQEYGYDSFCKVILMKQNDINSHVIHATIKDDNNTIDITKTNKAQMIAKLPNSAPCVVNGVIDGNSVYVDVTPSLLKYSGRCECELQLISSKTSVIASYNRANITKSVVVNETTFKEKCSPNKTYIFNYDGSEWILDADTVNLADYGITIEWDALENDAINVDYFEEQVWSSETFYISVLESVNEFADFYYVAKVDAIQLGAGSNTKEKTLQIYSDNIYNANSHTLTVQNIELNGVDVDEWFVRVDGEQDIVGLKSFKNNLKFDGSERIITFTNGENIISSIKSDANEQALTLTANTFVFAGTSIIPQTTDVEDIGSNTLKFKDLYLSGNTNIGGDAIIVGEALIGGDISIDGNATVAKNITISGDLTIKGNISQEGSTYESHAEQIYSTKDYIYLREGNTSALTDGTYSGLEFVKYDGINNGRLVLDKNGIARVGDAGDEQPLATREETPNSTSIAYWDSTNLKFVTSNKAYIKSGKIYSNSSEVVNLADIQTITGNKTFSGTVVLSSTRSTSGSTNNNPPLIIGGTATTAHIEIDKCHIRTKTNASSSAALYINDDGGEVFIGRNADGLQILPGDAIAPVSIGLMNLGKATDRFNNLYLVGNAYFATPDASSDAAIGATTAWVRGYVASQGLTKEMFDGKFSIAQGTGNANKTVVTDAEGKAAPSSIVPAEQINLGQVIITPIVDEETGEYGIRFSIPD